MKLEFTASELQQYFSGQRRHYFYSDTLELSKWLTVHANGDFPTELIEERRPSEIAKILEYRQKIFESITYPVMSKVFTALQKIRRSPDWSVNFDTANFSPRIPANQNPKDYLTEYYPQFGSLENWLFELVMPNYLTDSNAVIAVVPKSYPVDAATFINPICKLFRSEDVIDFIEGDYAVLYNDDDYSYVDDKGNTHKAKSYYIMTAMFTELYVQDGAASYTPMYRYDHNIGELPAFKVKGIVKQTKGAQILYKSRIDAMKPRLNEAIREYNDLAVEVVQNIFSERWEFGTDDCTKCKGKGTVKQTGFLNSSTSCGHCGGSGLEPRGPFSMIKLRPPMPGEQALPTPPAGFIEKSTEIVKIQDERVDKHIYHALSAVNLEFLADKPLNESGIAKAYDRDDINNFIHAVATDLVNIYIQAAYFIVEMRYSVLLPDQQVRFAHLPMVAVPERFDLLSAQQYEEEISRAKKSGTNPAIVTEMEKQFVNKRFASDDKSKARMLAILELDPLSGLTEEDKMVRLGNNGITPQDYVLSCNIYKLLLRAERENRDFYNLSREEQQDTLEAYAAELMPTIQRVIIPEDAV